MINYVNISCWVGIHGHSVVVVVCSFGFLVIIRCYHFFFRQNIGVSHFGFFLSHIRGLHRSQSYYFCFVVSWLGITLQIRRNRKIETEDTHTHKKNR